MNLQLWRHEVRRAGRVAWIAPPVTAAGVVLLAVVDRSDGAAGRDALRNLFAALELALPLIAGVLAASLVGRDPAAELLLTTPVRYRTVLLRRLTVIVGWTAATALAAAAVLIPAGRWEHGPVAGQLVWLAPTLWLAAAGWLAAAVLRSPGAAGGIVAVLWLLQQVLGGPIQDSRAGRLLYLFASTRGADPGDWAGNRAVLLGTAAGLGAAAWVLLGRAERLVHTAVTE
ncbi:hypothetical protein ABZS66_47415 [Dactylosporangium sp. NPDC005572]|uniref:hypothetical protein n=1 Tax=Dactylosporangium sp. NPDC005572 TaxID=3156889 RepID=UPI0033BEDDD2